jgi:RNA polymerase sigma-70 factor (ECF subfamily)
VDASSRQQSGDARGDAELLASSVHDDPEAFGVFYCRHVDRILAYFWSRTGDPDDASELTAETFAVALSALDRFNPSKGTPTQWLYGIASRQLRTFWRRNQISDRARRRLEIQTPLTATTGWEDLEAAEARLDGDRITGALDRVPVTNREAVRLRVVERLGYDEISQRLGCSPGAARVRVLRGLRRLGTEFETGGASSRPSRRRSRRYGAT